MLFGPISTPSRSLHPSVHRELIDLLYTSLPQVAAITVTSIIGSTALASMSNDPGYIVIAIAIAFTAGMRLHGLKSYPRAQPLSPDEAMRWERAYGTGASIFGFALGLLSLRALQLGDGPGAWISFGLSMSFCVGMVSRAAVRPWIVLVTAAMLLGPTVIGGFMRPELAYKLGAGMLFLFWISLREAAKHLSKAFVERLEAKRALAHQASHDALTGLPNRTAFLAALETAASEGKAFAVIAIDLDRFKPVNDKLGHHIGDMLLRRVAERLLACVGRDGMAARMGGDEFMLLLRFEGPEPDTDAARQVAEQAVARLNEPFPIAGPVTIGASAGIALGTPTANSNLDGLLEQVDNALYAAKRAGGGRWQWAEAQGRADGEVAA